MFRTGIYSIDQLSAKKLKDIFGSEKNISVALYNGLDKITDASERDALSELILNRFNSDRNVIKRTYRHRFDGFDELCVKLLRARCHHGLRLHDLAISDGRASVNFLNSLFAVFPSAEY